MLLLLSKALAKTYKTFETFTTENNAVGLLLASV